MRKPTPEELEFYRKQLQAKAHVVEAWRELRGDTGFALGWVCLFAAVVAGVVFLVGAMR